MTIPTRVREQAGLQRRDLVEFVYRRGEIVITPYGCDLTALEQVRTKWLRKRKRLRRA